MPPITESPLVYHLPFIVAAANGNPAYSDALNLTAVEYAALQVAQGAPSPPPPTDEELDGQVSAIIQQAAPLIAQMSADGQVAALTGITGSVVNYAAASLSDTAQAAVALTMADQAQAIAGPQD